MIHIVVEEARCDSLRREPVEYVTYVIYQGEIIASNRETSNNSKFIAKVLRHLGFYYKWHRISTLTASGQEEAEQLFTRLLLETDVNKRFYSWRN